MRLTRGCSVAGCDKPHYGQGFCTTHLYRFKKYGDPNHPVKAQSKRGENLSDGTNKVCSTCKRNLHESMFNKESRRPDGLSIYCKECLSMYSRNRYRKPEAKAKIKEKNSKWRERNPDADAEKNLKKKYGITLQQYNEMLLLQNGVCAICGQKEKVRRQKKAAGPERLAVDHCHESGRVRGLLCFKCNTAIGSLGDTEEMVQRVISYLAKSLTDSREENS